MDDLQARPSHPWCQPRLWLPGIATLQRVERGRLCPDRASISESRETAKARLELVKSLSRVRLRCDSSGRHRTCPPCNLLQFPMARQPCCLATVRWTIKPGKKQRPEMEVQVAF